MDFQSIALPTELPVRKFPNLTRWVEPTEVKFVKFSGSRPFFGGIRQFLTKKKWCSTTCTTLKYSECSKGSQRSVERPSAFLTDEAHGFFSGINSENVSCNEIAILMRHKNDKLADVFGRRQSHLRILCACGVDHLIGARDLSQSRCIRDTRHDSIAGDPPCS